MVLKNPEKPKAEPGELIGTFVVESFLEFRLIEKAASPMPVTRCGEMHGACNLIPHPCRSRRQFSRVPEKSEEQGAKCIYER